MELQQKHHENALRLTRLRQTVYDGRPAAGFSALMRGCCAWTA
jgi:hypothetical protein